MNQIIALLFGTVIAGSVIAQQDDHEGHDHDTHEHESHDHHADQHAHHGAHVHGVGHLNIAVEKGQVTVYLQTPAMDIVGFEHAPENDKEKQQLKAAYQQLNNAEILFSFSGADCTADQNSGVEVPSEASGYNDIIAEYRFVCSQDNTPESVQIQFSDVFPDLKLLNAVWITESGQGIKEVRAGDGQISFE